jgi:DNA-binding beta-propeller fold protein YncE
MRRAERLLATVAVAGALAGCGSRADLPPAAGPATSPPLTERPAGRVRAAPDGPALHHGGAREATVDGGRAVAVLSPRRRVLDVLDGATRRQIDSAAAGVGPTHVVAGPGHLVYVVDTGGDGLLVYELRPSLRLTRRLPLLGGPYGIAADPGAGRLWVTMTATNRLVELADGARPHHLRDFPSVRQPNAVAVDPVRHRVYVTGRADGVVQIVDGRDTAAPSRRTARR